MSFKFCSLSSGSSGNSQYIETQYSKILVDVGFTGKRTEELLQKIHVSPTEIDAIFVTHEHIDHIKGVGIMSRRYDIPIIANHDTWVQMEDKLGKIKEKNILVFENDRMIPFKDLDILPVTTSHDSANSCGYIFHHTNKKISIVTDTGCVSENLKDQMRDSDLYYIEANHDVPMLKYGHYPQHLKRRILANTGHLSNEACAAVLADLLHGSHERVMLAHLSQDNNTEELSYDTVNEYLTYCGLDTANEIQLSVAPRYEPTKVVDLDESTSSLCRNDKRKFF